MLSDMKAAQRALQSAIQLRDSQTAVEVISAVVARRVGGDPELIFTNLNATAEQPLHAACREGLTDVAIALINSGYCDIDTPTIRGGMSPLFLAAQCGNEHIVKELIEAGCDSDTSSYAGLTSPLHMALSQHSSNSRVVQGKCIFEMLVAYGANIAAKDSSGSTALHRAIAAGEGAVLGGTDATSARSPQYCLELLLAYGADVNAVDDDGRTPIQLSRRYLAAGETFHRLRLKILLDAGSDVEELQSDEYVLT